jgi:hypothetical protein
MNDKTFEIVSSKLLKKIGDKYENKVLKKIKFENLNVLVGFVLSYKPKSKIKSEENNLIEYLTILNNKDLNALNREQIKLFEMNYIYPIINRFMKYGFRYRFAWLYILIFVMIFDLTIFYFFNIFIPIFSIIFLIKELKKEIISYRNGKLW